MLSGTDGRTYGPTLIKITRVTTSVSSKSQTIMDEQIRKVIFGADMQEEGNM